MTEQMVWGACAMLDEIILADLNVADVMKRWPATIAVFQQHKMACVGCAVAPFFSVARAASIYSIPVEQFVQELGEVIASAGVDTISADSNSAS
ncbi:MAG: DUF1858 domain-containing protein [Anaerolineae bacterium]|nr:DUF1858 domain-containing protein [Anaerolineae bacterium]